MSHKTPEQMIEEGHEFATFGDLEGLDNSTLMEIAVLCMDEPADPDSCVPCKAFMILQEREDADTSPGEPEVEEYVSEKLAEAMDVPLDPESLVVGAGFEEAPVAERFAAKVRELDDMVALLLSGPPIPPPNVTMDELAALVVGAERWLKIIDAQGIELSPQQESIKAHIAAVITKVRRG